MRKLCQSQQYHSLQTHTFFLLSLSSLPLSRCCLRRLPQCLLKQSVEMEEFCSRILKNNRNLLFCLCSTMEDHSLRYSEKHIIYSIIRSCKQLRQIINLFKPNFLKPRLIQFRGPPFTQMCFIIAK